MKVIGIDMDEVLCDFMGQWIKFYNEKNNAKLSYKDIFSYNLWEVCNVEKEENIAEMEEFYKTSLFENIKPVSGSIQGISKLMESFELIIITSRPVHLRKKTLSWLEKNFPGVFPGVFFSRHVSLETKGKSKAEICVEQGAKAIVEDNIMYAEECAAAGIKVVLLDRPWNQGVLLVGVERVFSWEEAVKAINSFV